LLPAAVAGFSDGDGKGACPNPSADALLLDVTPLFSPWNRSSPVLLDSAFRYAEVASSTDILIAIPIPKAVQHTTASHLLPGRLIARFGLPITYLIDLLSAYKPL
jgi:hypothetical protein